VTPSQGAFEQNMTCSHGDSESVFKALLTTSCFWAIRAVSLDTTRHDTRQLWVDFTTFIRSGSFVIQR
jgi:hypothetical protein